MKPPPATFQRRLYLVDDEPAVRRGLAMLLNLQPDLLVCGDAADGATGWKEMKALKPDLAVVDLSLKHGSGFELIRLLHRRRPGMKVLVLTMHAAALYAQRALEAGAHGYVTKEEGADALLEAIRSVLQGRIYVSQKVAIKLAQQPGRRAADS